MDVIIVGGKSAEMQIIKDLEPLFGLIHEQHKDSFSFVCEEDHVDKYSAILRRIHRDFDVLPMKLGNFMRDEN